MAFDLEAVETVGDHHDTLQLINALVVRLAARKVGTVPFDTMQHNHALVWQIKVFEQAALHRIVSLANGCMKMWNAQDIYGSALFARSLMETTSLVHDLANQLAKAFENHDLSAARDLLLSRTFGARNDESPASARRMKAVNVLATIAKLDQKYPGALESYTHLAEMCHLNSLGMFAMFVIIDKDTKDVTFDYFKYYSEIMLQKIIMAFLLLELFESSLQNIQIAAQGLSNTLH